MKTLFDRITFNPHVMAGRACIRDLRVANRVNRLARLPKMKKD